MLRRRPLWAACAVLAALVLWAVPADAATEVAYDYWLYEPQAQGVTIDLAGPWSLRAWYAWGADDGQSAPDSFLVLDLGRALGPVTVYAGYERLAHPLDAGTLDLHEGLRVGVRGAVALSPELSVRYDLTAMPWDRALVSGVPGQGSGYETDLGLRIALGPHTFVQIGHRVFCFSGAPGETGSCGHEWLGPYLEVGARF